MLSMNIIYTSDMFSIVQSLHTYLCKLHDKRNHMISIQAEKRKNSISQLVRIYPDLGLAMILPQPQSEVFC